MSKRGVNKAIIVGNLGQDPEIRYTGDGKAVANFSVATSDVWKDQNGMKQERTEWHRLSAFDKTAEIIGKYTQKGTRVYCEGELRTRKWQDQSGTDHYTTSINVREVQILAGGVQSEQSAAPQNNGHQAAPPGDYYQRQNPPRQNPNGTQASPYANMPPANQYPEEDDIPF